MKIEVDISELIMLEKAAEMIGVTSKTLRNWDKEGKVYIVRTKGGHRRIPKSEVERLASSRHASKLKDIEFIIKEES